MSRIQKRFGWRERRTLWALRIAAQGIAALIRRKIYGWLGIRHFRGMQIRPGTIDIWTLGETFLKGNGSLFLSKDETTTYFIKRYFGKPRMPQGSRLFE